MYFSDKASTDFLRDYFTNRLTTSGMGRPFDLSVGANKSLNQQIKEAQKTITTSLGGDKRMQGPIDFTSLQERGVEAVLQGKVPPMMMRRLLTLENALIRTGTEARANPALTAFYESLATGGGSSINPYLSVGYATSTELIVQLFDPSWQSKGIVGSLLHLLEVLA